ncbi:MAG: right-handed parallel beta-helix repeat-containing protein [Bacteroidales bacterium]|nr:right-handed parallel beta-helix repeat-containing protein [Bacteroidales bacterium]
MFRILKHIFPLLLFFPIFFACEKEEFNTSSDAHLIFSQDTILFDTVFTTIGTATQRFTVKNPYNKNINLSSIYLAGGENSPYRLNIDGFPGKRLNDIELRAKDSLYIFVEVTIDPNNSDLPLVVQDSIVFSFNNTQQDINLIAWGQDVNLINGEIIETETWTANKPYLIYNSMLVDSLCVLTIEPGAILHFHKNSRLYVAGTILADGTLESPITFQGDRLEDDYDDIPGQWDGIWLMAGSKNNIFNYSHIKNAIIGIQTDTLENIIQPTLSISNSIIENMTSAGIYAQGSSIKAYNTVVSNCGQFAIALTIGGSYEFYHCTIGNYWGFSTRTTPSLLLNNYYFDDNGNIQKRPINKALFGNCIIYGNKESEIYIDKDEYTLLSYKFDHSLIKVSDEFSVSDPNYFENVIVTDPGFVNPYNGNFELNESSDAVDEGKAAYGIMFPLDINMQNRNADIAPDLGAFERVETP